ncbi:Peptidase S8, subtilisin-related [Parasponia andersonii]|uniref:Peptidase S8, subtilisin-related n=1 Tax=Parasponia andersonii TaxID=3476 RepID=A0A2P5D9H0_PARAD|nr:Peptidase S8, subtilisin-related [Parasponia andersonii]
MNCTAQEKKVYIVYAGEKQSGDFNVASIRDSFHYPMLERILGSTVGAKESLVCSYGRSFSGFAAKLSTEEVEKLSEMEGIVSVLPSTKLQLYTTRSWDFLGQLSQSHTRYH